MMSVIMLPTLLSFTNDKSLDLDSEHTLEPIKRGNAYSLDRLNSFMEPAAEAIVLPEFNVTITMYEPVNCQTDSSPDITADGTKIDLALAGDYNYVALSRNLLKRWGGLLDYGDFILIEDAGGKSGIYQVKDTMHPRFVNYVDILESPGSTHYKFKNAKIKKHVENIYNQTIVLN